MWSHEVPSAPNIAIVGVTGAVGQEFLRVIDQRNLPFDNLKLLASARSAGKQVEYQGKTYTVEELTEDSFGDVDIALFSAGGSISKKLGPVAAEAGAVVIDNSSAFRMDPNVPLVVPEVNPEAVQGIEVGNGGSGSSGGGIIANPNCSTIIMLVPVTPLHKAARVKRMVVSTYQAASGAGQAAMDELELQSKEVLEGKAPTCNIFPFQYAFNLFSHNSDIGDDGYNTEETKMVKESHKIWNDTSVGITTTCVRVPVMRAHAESINLEFEHPLDEEEAKRILSEAPGVSIIDDRGGKRFPTPLDASHQDDIYVGRIRNDQSRKQVAGHGIDLFVCGDQLRKGAALNAVQIAELLLAGVPAV